MGGEFPRLLPTMGRERRCLPLPETSILELLTIRRTDLTVNRDLDLQQDQPPHPRRETLTTSKPRMLDSKRGSKPDHNNFLNNSSNSNSHRDSHRDSLNSSSNSNSHRDSHSSNSNSNSHRDSHSS